MRLIDANELKKLYEDYEGLKVPCEVVLQNIDDMPTAYDIDEKVSKLEELIEENEGYLRATPEASDYIKAIRDAIEIVRAGMKEFIEVNDAAYREKMLINVNKIIYVCPIGNGAYIRYANTDEEWGGVKTTESFDEICEMLRNRRAGEKE